MNVGDARREYLALMVRCLTENPNEEGYIKALYGDWDRELDKIGDDVSLRPWFDQMTSTIQKADKIAALEWLDAYPDAIVSSQNR